MVVDEVVATEVGVVAGVDDPEHPTITKDKTAKPNQRMASPYGNRPRLQGPYQARFSHPHPPVVRVWVYV
jgi:hypothetical protein